jgi:DNA invertase Pin-like site-specific DNA recombinase
MKTNTADVAIYARYSTDRQDARSIDDQMRRCRALADTRGFSITAEYADAAVSGSHMDRVNLKRLISDARRGSFRSVLVDDLSRLSRDLGDTWRIVFEDLASVGTKVIDVTTGMSSDADGARVTFGALALVNDTFLQLVKKETHRGLEGRALQGFATGGKCFGYTSVVEENPPDTEHPRKVPVIDVAEAEIVRRVFRQFVEGQSCHQIAFALNEEGVSAPHDGGKGHKHSRGWGHTTIRAMLLNHRYVGRWTWNQRKWVRVPGKKSRRAVDRPETEHITKDIPTLRIVPADLWNAAQQRFRRTMAKRLGRPHGSTREPSLLGGLLKCGTCGGSIAIVSRVKKNGAIYQNLGCNVYRSRGAAICSNNNTISEKKVRDAVLGFLRETVADPALVARFIKQFEQHYAQLEKNAPAAELGEKIRETEQRVRNLLDALAKMGWSESLAARVKEEEERLTTLRGRAVDLGRARQKTVPHPKTIEGYLRNLVAILDGDRTRAREILAKHLGHLVLTPGKNGYQITGAFGLHLTPEGEVGGLLVCDNSSSGGVI